MDKKIKIKKSKSGRLDFFIGEGKIPLTQATPVPGGYCISAFGEILDCMPNASEALVKSTILTGLRLSLGGL